MHIDNVASGLLQLPLNGTCRLGGFWNLGVLMKVDHILKVIARKPRPTKVRMGKPTASALPRFTFLLLFDLGAPLHLEPLTRNPSARIKNLQVLVCADEFVSN
jgi:hypothetical protein